MEGLLSTGPTPSSFLADRGEVVCYVGGEVVLRRVVEWWFVVG